MLLFTMWLHNFKDCVKMIKVSESEPPHIHHVVEDVRENKACYSGFKKFACLSAEPAGGSGAAERDNPSAFRGE